MSYYTRMCISESNQSIVLLSSLPCSSHGTHRINISQFSLHGFITSMWTAFPIL